MRTTLELPDKLVSDAMKVSHQHTKTAVIVSALEDLVRKDRIGKLHKYRGTVELDIDLDASRKRI